jgi:hypothetical protein
MVSSHNLSQQATLQQSRAAKCCQPENALHSHGVKSWLLAAQGQETGEGARELRAGALGFFASVLRRFPDAVDYAPLWPRLLAAAEPLLPRLVAEVC